MIVCFISLAEDKQYLSALVVDKGCIKGISDMISKEPFYKGHALASARAQRIYMTSQGSIGVILDGDIKSPDCVASLLQRGASTLLFLTLSAYDPLIKRYLDAQTLLNKITLAGTFSDKWFIYNKELALFAQGSIHTLKTQNSILPNNIKKAYEKVFYEF